MKEIFMINQLWQNKTTWSSQKVSTGKGDDYTTGCLLDYPYLKGYYWLTAFDLSKKCFRCWSKSN